MGQIGPMVAFFLISIYFSQLLAAPSYSTNSWVVDFPGQACSAIFEKNANLPQISSSMVEIYQMRVKSIVRNRFARTTVISKVWNCGGKAKESIFSVILPESAFISSFVMEVDGKNYTAYVKEKEEAKQAYQKAVSSGLGAAHVEVSARDSNRITVSVNVEPATAAAFYLVYEELLKRQDGHYEIVINLNPGQPVKDLSVEVDIIESRKITSLKTIPLRSANEINKFAYSNGDTGYIQTISGTSAKVGFSPNLARQKEYTALWNNAEKDGLSGQFVVEYDVERDRKGGEVLVEDGYFVHFFAPSELPRLPKHVVFVLDTSSSMQSRKKLEQLQEAMYEILDDLSSDDIFHLVEFNDDVNVWVLKDSSYCVKYTTDNMQGLMANSQQHQASSASPANIRKAKVAVSRFKAVGWTDIYKALRIGISLVQLSKLLSTSSIIHQPMIIFLTDGDPTKGETSTEKIVKEITKFNTGLRKTPIFALSFGDDADRSFLRNLALSNSGFPKHIYEAADAALQLQNFYHEISSPLLANVVFKYETSASNLTETDFALHFRGAELVTAGRYDPSTTNTGFLKPVNAWNGEEDLSFQPTVQQSASSIERLWAYLTVKQLLDKKDMPDMEQEELKKKAIQLSLKYSFVTPVTSLVVVKPENTNRIEVELAKGNPSVALEYDPDTISKGPRDPEPSFGVAQHPAPTNTFAVLYYKHTDADRDVRCHSYACADREVEGCFYMESPQQPVYDPTKTLYFNIQNGLLILPTGRYMLGENETISETSRCTNSLLNSDGHCRLLHSCVSNGLSIRTDDYLDHFCILKNGYAGICCPDSWYREN